MSKFLNRLALTVVVGGCAILGSFAWIWTTETYSSTTPPEPTTSSMPTIHVSDGMERLPEKTPQLSIDEPSNWHDLQAVREAAAMLALLDYWDFKDRHGSGVEYPTDTLKNQYAFHLQELSKREGRSIVHVSNVVETMIEQIQGSGKTGTRLEILNGLNNLSKEFVDYTLEEIAAGTLALMDK